MPFKALSTSELNLRAEIYSVSENSAHQGFAKPQLAYLYA